MLLTCPACGLSFETQASTNTRCRRCRKVINIGARRSPARVSASADDSSAQWSPTVIGVGLVAGGVGALWYGVKLKQVSRTDPDAFTGREKAWLVWCFFGAALVASGSFVVWKQSG